MLLNTSDSALINPISQVRHWGAWTSGPSSRRLPRILNKTRAPIGQRWRHVRLAHESTYRRRGVPAKPLPRPKCETKSSPCCIGSEFCNKHKRDYRFHSWLIGGSILGCSGRRTYLLARSEAFPPRRWDLTTSHGKRSRRFECNMPGRQSTGLDRDIRQGLGNELAKGDDMATLCFGIKRPAAPDVARQVQPPTSTPRY